MYSSATKSGSAHFIPRRGYMLNSYPAPLVYALPLFEIALPDPALLTQHPSDKELFPAVCWSEVIDRDL